MTNDCDHKPPEAKRGIGPCRIEAEVKLRNGDPNWWCRTHGQQARGPGGQPLESCPGSWFDEVPAERRLDLNVEDGEIALWGTVPPALRRGELPEATGQVHVHRRRQPTAEKDIDQSFDIVTVHNGNMQVLVEGTSAVAASISELTGRSVVPLTCRHCGEVHLDELKFATRPHSKHLCNSCGRNFRDKQPSISNPLADAYERLGIEEPPKPATVDRPLSIRSHELSALAIWPSNTALISTMTRPEEIGLHVHGWDLAGDMVLDETYSYVTLDGVALDPEQVRLLAVQRALAHGAPIISLSCGGCGSALTMPLEDWVEPTTAHPCARCGKVTRTSRRSFVNPLAT